ncbi:hemin uptake protein HemP [Elioraea rosea]|nr:hemin uptake protein HemP [Elioraea rosea]
MSTTTLFEGRAELEIDHRGEIYRLRITRTGKLILTK